jgi:two-component system NtrC family response regulator
MGRILIIDDDEIFCRATQRDLTKSGHDVTTALTIKEGLKAAKSENADVVFLDVRLPDGNGLDHLPAIRSMPSSPEVIIITSDAYPDGAEIAIKNNAWDYIQKPVSNDVLALALKRVIQYREERNSSKPAVPLNREGIIGNSPKIKTCLDLVSRAATTTAHVLVTGETGTGKEVFARAIHANSLRAEKNFVVVDCGSLPETIMESVLFGHTKGAFTGADSDKEGLIKHADGGTLFLDEIGELSLSMQKVFLRVLQEHSFRAIGDSKEITSDFRLIAATNRDLNEMVDLGKFREDLLFRLRSVTINLPPLRERAGDIKELAVNYLRALWEANNEGMKGFSPDFLDVLAAYRWPGNVRELYSALESAAAHAQYEPTLFPKHLPTNIRIEVARSSVGGRAPDGAIAAVKINERASGELLQWKDFKRSLIAEGEKGYLRDLMLRAAGEVKKASKLSGLSQPRLYELLRKHGISRR